jgi:hypothetical protein
MPTWLHTIMLHPAHYIWLGGLIFVGLCVLGAIGSKSTSKPRAPHTCTHCKGNKWVREYYTDAAGHRAYTDERCFNCKGTGMTTDNNYL